MMKSVVKVVESKWQPEGSGAMVRRSIGRPELRKLDPFLLLDEFAGNGKDGSGFPDHPHRGFETVSYLLEGEFYHEDFVGHKGRLGPGDLQWMTAGRGVVHSEMPGPVDTKGLQLWVNLRAAEKMIEPGYQELSADEIRTNAQDGTTVKVIAGESMGVKSPVRTRTPTYFLDFTVNPGSRFEQPVPSGWASFAYILKGAVTFGSTRVEAHHTVVFDGQTGDKVAFKNEGQATAKFVLIAGQPIGEPVVQHGPFVMNTKDEIQQALSDYHKGQNGFERAVSWKSVMGNQ